MIAAAMALHRKGQIVAAPFVSDSKVAAGLLPLGAVR
jgi:hypothetical protein